MGLLQPPSDRSTGNAVVNWSPGFVSEGALPSVFYLVLAQYIPKRHPVQQSPKKMSGLKCQDTFYSDRPVQFPQA